MGTDPVSLDRQKEESNAIDDIEDLPSILKEYETLTDTQDEERRELLERIDEITRRTRKLDNIDEKLDRFSSLLLDIRSQIAGNPDDPEHSKQIVPKPNIPVKPEVMASNEEIQQLSKEVQKQSDNLDEEIASLSHLLEKKRKEVDSKDQTIEQLNDRLDLLGEEKSRLVNELENLNSVIDSWKSQLDLLQKLASSDPRYRVIEALKKHGSLSDIQLAFTMGTSINQLRKYIEDLVDLKLVQKGANGRYVWSGKELDTEL